MSRQPFELLLFVGFTLLACSIGCDNRPPEKQAEDTENVLREIGVSTEKPGQIGVPLPPGNTPGQSDDLQAPTAKNSPGGDSVTSSEQSHRPNVTVDDPLLPWISADRLPRDVWEVQYIGNNPVGYLRRKTEVSKSHGNKVFRIEAESNIRVSINGKVTKQRLSLSTIEKDNGEIIHMEGELEIGENKHSFQAFVHENSLRLEGAKNGKSFVEKLPWHPDNRGPFAVDQSLLRRPMQPKETRTLKYFDPLLAKIIDGKLEADDYIVTPTMLGGSRELLEIRNFGSVGSNTVQALMWVDKAGDGYKSYLSSVDIKSFRTDANAAQVVAAITEMQNVDILSAPLAGPIERILDHQSTKSSATFRIKHKTKDPFGMVSDRVCQRLKSIDPRTVDVTVYRIGVDPNSSEDILSERYVDEKTLASTSLLPLDDPLIKKLAAALLAADKEITPQSTSLAKANACRLGLFQRIGLKEFDRNISPPSVVLKSKLADCIEHALILTAVCRIHRIHARVALGVMFNRSQSNPEMKFHAWVEIRDGQRWIPIDSTDSIFPASIDRVKFTESDFTGPNPHAEIAKVLRRISELEFSIQP